MKTKHILIIFIALITLFFLWSCGETSKKVTDPDIQVSPEESKDRSSDTSNEYRTKTGKTIIISITHPVGQSLNTIKISTKDFEHNYPEIYEDRDPISDLFVADLDGYGFDEIYIITTSAGSGS